MRQALIVVVAFCGGLDTVPVARAQSDGDAPLKFNCVIRDAQILPSRTHVRCANKGLNGLSEFAAETSQPYANRVADAIVQALRSGSTLVLTYAPASDLNPDGCAVRTCRKIIDVGGTGRVSMPSAQIAPEPLQTEDPAVKADDLDVPQDSFDDFVGPSATTTPAFDAPPTPLHRPMQPVPN